MRKNRIIKSLIYDLSVIFFLFFISYFLGKYGKFLCVGRIVTDNQVNSGFVRSFLYFSGGIYMIIMLLFVRRTQSPVVMLIKFLILLLTFSIIVLYILFVNQDKGEFSLMIYFALILVVLVSVSVKSFLLVINNKLLLSNEGIEVKGDYGQIIQFDSIEDISVRYAFPKLSYRVKGVAFMNIRKGRFKLANGDECFAYITLEKPLPILRIERKNEVPIYLNCKTPQQTLSLYTQYILIRKQ